MKKLVFTFCALLLLAGYSKAQDRVVEKSFSIKPTDNLRLKLKFGDMISVKSWDKDEVAFKAVIKINNGKLNDALDLSFDRNNGQLQIASDYDKALLHRGNVRDCAGDDSTYQHWSSFGSSGKNYMICSHIKYEIFVPAEVNLDVESISSNIELVNLAGPIRAKSISGFVDLSWPAGKPADIALKTVSGEAYTNLKGLEFKNKKDHIPIVGYKLRGNIGTGVGPSVSLESVSGNIYLRRAQS
ncbi:MAG TPA: hypothetical protein VJ964_07280 [Balneolaceae bacterium]|nr:hypothetical protein [Balneolaceae bacterium]